MARCTRLLAFIGLLVLMLAIAAAPAAATITPVAGDCTGNGQFNPGGFKDAASASVTIPQKATVAWAGAVIKPAPPPDQPRKVDGWVALELPMGQKVTLGEWPSTGVLVNNSGSYDYDLPSVLAGFDMTFSGEHYEEDSLWCKGEVTIQVEGSNPLGIAAVALTVISVVGVSLSVKRRPGTGSVDITEYRKGDVI